MYQKIKIFRWKFHILEVTDFSYGEKIKPNDKKNHQHILSYCEQFKKFRKNFRTLKVLFYHVTYQWKNHFGENFSEFFSGQKIVLRLAAMSVKQLYRRRK